MPSKRRLATAALVLTAASVTGVAIYGRIQSASAASGGEGTAQAPRPLVQTSASGSFATDVAIPVQGSAARLGELVMSVNAAGQAEAWQKNVLVAQVNGRIVGLRVREGDLVGGGQGVVALDGAEYQLAVEEAQAAVRDAEGKFREATLFDDQIEDAGVRRDRAAASRTRSGLETAEVRLRRARLDLTRTRLATPFAGRVASLKVV
ncbi:MAG TPA: biotin/lipoyl-binding protein, partial [Longimicrobium sp.]|nr:biotin/lipoyl-binding protein [Longimicrobium sp.]